MKYLLPLILLSVTCLGLLGCETAKNTAKKVGDGIGTFDPIYRPDVVQGNFVSAEQVAAVRIGMPRDQVKMILGTPLLTDVFHVDRWDYVFTLAKAGKAVETKRLAVFFKNDLLDRLDGDIMPSENDFVRSLSSERKVQKVPPLVATDKQLESFTKANAKNNAQQVSPGQAKAPSTTTSAPDPTAPPLVFEKTYPSLEKN